MWSLDSDPLFVKKTLKMASVVNLAIGAAVAGATVWPSWALDTGDHLLRETHQFVKGDTNMLIMWTALAVSMVGMLFASAVGSVRGR